MTETAETRLKRLKVRAWRRGIKEMDLILGRFVDTAGPDLTPPEVDALEALMEESDLDVYAWVAGRAEAPPQHAKTVNRLRDYATRG